jgi:Arc/MetJ-type ribon-helix-helix transcriptional regulator
MPKISLDMPADKKFVSLADAIRTACRKLLDQLDEIDQKHGRV